ncbi:MAG: PQQ-binding-like beta-propeller repeat protein [Phycisphaerales bacterium]
MRPIDPRFAIGLTSAWVAAAPALAQPQQVLPYPDDSVIAKDALPRVKELAEAGNQSEAVRVVQSVLESESDAVVESDEPLLYIPVRAAVHRLLMAAPELLERYRLAAEPKASALLASGDARAVERSFFLTPSGLEAALALAEMELESARFESARMILEEVASHPDYRKGSNAGRTAKLASQVARYIPREDVRAWAASLRSGAGLEAADAPAVKWPRILALESRSSLTRQPSADLAASGLSPLQTLSIGGESESEREGEPAPRSGRDGGRDRQPAWVLPTVREEVLFINDGTFVRALDHSTLSPLWRIVPGGDPAGASLRDNSLSFYSTWRGLEDVATVTVHADTVLATMGTPAGGTRSGDRRLYAMDAATGAVRWSADVPGMHPALIETSVRGPVLVEGDTVVVTARRQSGANRTIGVYFVGLDLSTGDLRWVRHLGSIGSVAWSRQASRPEGAAVANGLVFRSDEVGLIAAVEVATGRPRWVRLVPSGRGVETNFGGPEAPPSYEISIPIVVGDSVYAIDPASAAIVRYEAATGRVLGSRRLTESGPRDAAYAPKYLVKTGEQLAVVCEATVVFLPLGEIANAKVRRGPALDGDSTPVGRAAATDKALLIPVRGGVLTISPDDPQKPAVTPLAAPGNLVIAGEGSGLHPITVDGSSVHTFLGWDEARRVLEARLERDPKDTRPLLTYIELASRAGHAEMTPRLADLVLSVTAQLPSAQAAPVRAELFELLLAMVRAGRTVAVAPRREFRSLQPITDPQLLDGVVQRLGLAGEEPGQQVEYLFELASLRETQGRAADAVDALQRVLLDPALAAAGAMAEDPQSAVAKSLGSEEAARRLTLLLRRAGHLAYAAFDAQATAEFAELPPDADGPTLAGAAARFPLAVDAPGVLRRASAWFAEHSKDDEALGALGRALVAEETSVSIGRPDRLGVLAGIADELAAFGLARGRAEAAERLLTRLETEYAGVKLRSVADRADRAALLAARRSAPKVADGLAASVQVIPGWVPVEPVLADVPGRSGDCTAMVSEGLQKVGVWGVNLATDRLEPLWERDIDGSEPVLLAITHDTSMLFWPAAGGGEIEAVSNYSGKTVWRTAEFSSIFREEGAVPPQAVRTPMDMEVRNDDFLVATSGRTLVMMQRTGRCAAFDTGTGELLWRQRLQASRVFEVAIAGGHLMVAGLSEEVDAAGAPPFLVSLAIGSGATESSVRRDVLGDHVRWIKPINDHEVLAATSDGLLRIDAVTGASAWHAQGDVMAMTASGWVVGETAFVNDDQGRLWGVSLKDGSRSTEQVDTRGRVAYPLRGVAVDGRLVLTSPSGVVVLNPAGAVVGVDSVNSNGRLLQPVLAQGRVVTADSYDERAARTGDESGSVVRLFLFDDRSAKLAAAHRIAFPVSQLGALSVIDGKVLISAGPATLVYSTR